MHKLCCYVSPNNQTCGSSALKNSAFCHHHSKLRKRSRRRRPTQEMIEWINKNKLIVEKSWSAPIP
jgi:hypothetical protein